LIQSNGETQTLSASLNTATIVPWSAAATVPSTLFDIETCVSDGRRMIVVSGTGGAAVPQPEAIKVFLRRNNFGI